MPLAKATVDNFSSREWRLGHLYWIEDSYGEVIRFELNAAQSRLLADLHYMNLVLKARQLGFSTLLLIMALDCCLFNSNFSAGLVADTLDNAKNLLKRVKFAYDHLPAPLQRAIPLTASNSQTMEFGNGSSVNVGVSLRSGTFNFIHISEYGKICAQSPEKAKEIKSGSLNTLAPRQLAFIESTAEGKGGDFYDKVQQARRLVDAHRDPGEMEYKFHFFPWFEDPKYISAKPFAISQEMGVYFARLLNEHGIQLTDQQKWWYAAKRIEQGDDMLKEFPATPDEAFEGAMDGAVYGREIRALRVRHRIGQFGFVPGIAINTFWDFGISDAQTIWLHQEVAGENRFIGYLESSGEGLGYYIDALNRWRALRSGIWGRHWAPHDVDARRPGVQVTTIKDIAAGLGWEFETVARNPSDKAAVIDGRQKLPGCTFDEFECAAGIEHLESWSYEWNEDFSVWSSVPRHDQHSHCCKAFQTFTDGYAPAYKGTLPQIGTGYAA